MRAYTGDAAGYIVVCADEHRLACFSILDELNEVTTHDHCHALMIGQTFVVTQRQQS